jgi:hypothetical protein
LVDILVVLLRLCKYLGGLVEIGVEIEDLDVIMVG